jgi:hypothetical protein
MDSTRQQQLIKQRAVARGMLTRIQAFIETGEQKINDLQVRFNKLSDIFSRYDTAQCELELSDGVDHSADREHFETQYYQVEARFHELLYPVGEPPRSKHSSHSSSSSRHSHVSPNSHHSSTHIKLPVISLPIFEGETTSWLHFRDTFEALIVHNTTLSNVQKFHYLTASLKGEAKGVISNLQITNENFSVAWKLVTHRYNNQRLISMMHAKNLCCLPATKKSDASSLRNLINHVSSHINALQALTLNVPIQDLMMNHLLLSSLDAETQREWELLTASREDIPSTSDLITFLESRCRALELLQNTQSAKTVPASPRQTPTYGGKVGKPSFSNVATHIQCTLCSGSHRLFKCDTFLKLQPQQRLQHAKQRRLCFNCLQSFTKDHICSKQVCHKCQNRHHTLLHVDSQPQSTINVSPVEKNQSVNTQGVTSANVNTYHTLKGKPRNHTLLATAIVEVRNKSGDYMSCRALLDSGSQSHFITERCAQRLRLPRTQTRTSIQGISNVNTSTGHSVSIHLRSRHTDWHTTRDCAVLPNITGMTPATKLDTTDWKLPTDIKLADEQFHQPGNIDLLIGADLFYEITRPGRRTRPGFPVLQETVLGWTAAGRTPPLTTSTSTGDVKCAFLQRETKSKHIRKRFSQAIPVKQSTRMARQQAGEKRLHTHNPRQEGTMVHRHLNKEESIQHGTSRFRPKRESHRTDSKLGQSPTLKVQDCNFMKKHEDTSQRRSVRFNEGIEILLYSTSSRIQGNRSMESATAERKLTKPVCTAQQTATTNRRVNFCAPHQGGTTEETHYAKAGRIAAYAH